jgi:superfamily I DNA and/or RNA helicase/very-short-patch-repair endonuclease
MELQTKQAILKYFKNCIEEDSKESLKINLNNNKSNIYFPLWEDENFDKFLNLYYEENEKNTFYQTLWINIENFDNDFLTWFFINEKINFDKSKYSTEQWWKYEINWYIKYETNWLRQKILNKLNIYKKLIKLELSNLEKEDLENLFFSPDNNKKWLSKIDFKPNLDFLDFYDNNKNENFYLVLEYIKVFDKSQIWKNNENVITPLYLIWMEITSNEDWSFSLSLKESEPEFLYNIKTRDNKNIFPFYSNNPWDDGFKEMEDLENNIKWITSSFKEKISYYKSKIDKNIKIEDFIYNPCIITWNNNIAIIKNLINDYNWIIKENQKLEELTNNSLWFLFNENLFEENKLNSSILNITELNKEQANIVKNSLNQNISVVIWPPWTWKSQVVLNLLANIYSNNKTVIFASKNNTAVDTVVEKFEKIWFPFFPFLRLWNKNSSKEWSWKILWQLNKESWVHKKYDFIDIENQKEKINSIYENIENIEKEYLDYYQEYEKFELLLWEIADEEFKSFLYKILPLNINFDEYKKILDWINRIIFEINNLNKELYNQEWNFLSLKSEIKNKNIENNLSSIFSKDLEKFKYEFIKEYDFFIKNINQNEKIIKEQKEKIKSNKIIISSKYKTIKNFNFEDNLDFLLKNDLEYVNLSLESKKIIDTTNKENLNKQKYDLDKYFLDKNISDNEIIEILKKWKFLNYNNNLILELQKIKNTFIEIEEYWWFKKLFWIKKKNFKVNENLYLEIINRQDNENLKNYFLNLNKTQSNDNKDILEKIQYIYSLKNYEEIYKKYRLSIENLNLIINKKEDFIKNIQQKFWDLFINKEFDNIPYDFEIISLIYSKLKENIEYDWIIEKNNNIIEKLNNNFSNYINSLSQELYLNWIELNYENILKLFYILIELQKINNQINDFKLKVKNKNNDKNEIEDIVYENLINVFKDKDFLSYIKEKYKSILDILEKIISLEGLNQIKNNITELSKKLKENKNNISLLSKELSEEQEVLKKISIDYLSYQIFENIKNNKSELKDAIEWIYNAYSRIWKDIYNFEKSNIFYKKMYEKLFWKINIFVTTNQSTWNLPLEKWFYDYLIIDEASQNDLASIIPLMYRCKKLIIIWDPNQLQNITKLKEENARQIFVQKLKEINIESTKYEYEFKHIYNFWNNKDYNLSAFNSINHIYNWNFNKETFSLREHYRCYPDIINFSNEIIQDYNLFPKNYIKNLNINPQITPLWVHWLKNIKSKDIQKTKQNEDEAKIIIEYLKELNQFYWTQITIWVISPYRNQVNLLNNLWNNYLRQFSLWETKNILIDTVHKFQWDEKDIILYSPVYPKSNLWNDKNLLNVAISRAKSWFYIFWDKDAIYKAHDKNWINLMKKLIDYIDIIFKQKEWIKINKFDSEYEKLFFKELEKAKIKFDFHVFENNWKYELDFKLKLKWFNGYLNIELDWGSHDNKKSYDYTRNVVIEKLWYKVIRYTNKYLMANMWEIIENLKKVCELENDNFLYNIN